MVWSRSDRVVQPILGHYLSLTHAVFELCIYEVLDTFTRLFDESFKNHYTNIMQEIERLIANQTPLQYTLNFTTDIKNLYYYNDDCTAFIRRLALGFNYQ